MPRQLPAAVPAFVGRRDQLAALTKMLRQPGGTAVITAIGGMAGVGKTALALHWAHQFAADFPDGQLFVNLRGFDPSGTPVRPADAVRLLLDALQIPADRLPQSMEAQVGLYRSLLAGQRMLLVLDNARDAAQVRPLLPGSPTCRVIVTSRNLLTGLAAVGAAQPLILDVLTGAEAGQLLQRRLGAARLAADPAAAAQIIKSCARLPLALCVIAARAAMRPDLSLARVATDLAERSNEAFADGGDPAADVRAVLSWSYRQLDAVTARAFRLAALHPGPELDRYAMAALTGTTAGQAGHMLDVLAHACLVQPSGPGRYGMHDLLRGYARELAADSGAGDGRLALTRLFDYYLHTASTAVSTLFPTEQHLWPPIPAPDTPAPALTSEDAARAWLDAERAGLVGAAGMQVAENGWPGHAIRLSAILFRYLEVGAHYAEAVTVYSSACRAARSIGDRAGEASALNSLSAMDFHLGHYPQALTHLTQAAARYGETGDQARRANVLANLGFVEFHEGHCQQAVRHLEQALTMLREMDDQIGQARVLASLGFAGLRQGRYQQATDYLREALALFRKIGDAHGVPHALSNLGEAALRQGHYQQAVSHLQQALALGREIGDRRNEADMLALLGIADLRQGNYQQATSHLNQALALCRETNDMPAEAAALNGLGEVLHTTGLTAHARTQHAAPVDVASQVGEKYEQARAHAGLARAYQVSGDTGQARFHGHEALTRYTELGAPEANQIRTQLTTGNGRPRG